MTNHSYMSAQAQMMLDALATREGDPPSRNTIEAHRAQAREEFLPRAERAVERYGVSIAETDIAGQPCLDIYPKGDVRGTVLYCYGGGYISGSSREDLIVSAALSALAGVRVVSVEYPLAPERPWPAACDAAFAVYEALSGGSDAIALAGESAGGNLALTIMLRAKRAPLGVVLMSPWCDLTQGGDSLEANNGRDPTLGRDRLKAAAALYAGDADASDPEISPINGHFASDGPPVIITTGTRDLLFSQCAELARRMQAAGQEVRLDVYDGLWHVFEFYDELPEAAQSLEACATFLRGCFQR